MVAIFSEFEKSEFPPGLKGFMEFMMDRQAKLTAGKGRK